MKRGTSSALGTEGQDRAEDAALAAGASQQEAARERWREEFFECGEVLDAYREAARAAAAGEPPPVLLIDEVEKLPVPILPLLIEPTLKKVGARARLPYEVRFAPAALDTLCNWGYRWPGIFREFENTIL